MELTQETVDTALYEGRSRMSKGGRKTWTQCVLWDDCLPGFGLRITPRNRKSFIVKYRAKGRRRTKTLGVAGRLKLDEARRRASEFLASVAEEQPETATGPPKVEGVTTVAQLADAYLEGYLKSHVPSWYADQRLIRTHVKPAMGRASIAEVTQTDLTNLRQRVAKRFPADARRLATLLAGMFDWAAERGLWSKSSRGGGAAASAPDAASTKPGPPPEPAAEATAEELRESLERSEAERRALAERLDEVSASGSEMLSRLGEQAAALHDLEGELARARRELDRKRRAGEGQPTREETEKQLATLRQSVEQLMESLREAREEGREAAENLAEAEARVQARGEKAAALMGQRDELEARLRERESRIAALKSRRRAGGGRVALWLAVGAVGGALLTLVAQRAIGPEPAAAPGVGQPAAAVAGAAETGDVDRAAGSGGAAAEAPVGAAAEPELETEPRPAATAGVEPMGEAAGEGGAAGSAEPAASPAGPDLAAAEAAVRTWAAAWSEQRVDDYLAAYSERFVPPDGLGRQEWSELRRRRIERPASIELTLDGLRATALAADRVRVDFEQGYRTEAYADTVRKSIELVWEDGGWRIAVERAE